ncbi:MAG: hypothetical protein KBC47_00635 [Candidatus Peribacteraceae bacterium]|nr:hypothetical protein [Candidatus Peribacteraceae bacterium]
MDLQTLSNKVQLSRLLTESERTYWVGNLPHMSEEQLQKLETILQEAQELSWSTEMQTYMSIANKATAALAA